MKTIIITAIILIFAGVGHCDECDDYIQRIIQNKMSLLTDSQIHAFIECVEKKIKPEPETCWDYDKEICSIDYKLITNHYSLLPDQTEKMENDGWILMGVYPNEPEPSCIEYTALLKRPKPCKGD